MSDETVIRPSNESNGPNDRYRKVENHPWELLPCRLCGFSAELWQRWVRDDIWCSFGACSNLEDVDGEACIFHLPDSGHFYCERKSEAVRYWNLMMGPRGSNETGALREALENISTVRPLEHFPAVTALAYCREKAIEALKATREFQEVIVGEYEADGKINMASSPLPEGTKLYARLPLRHSEKANSCVCGEPNSPGTHRTDGPCLAPIGDRR